MEENENYRVAWDSVSTHHIMDDKFNTIKIVQTPILSIEFKHLKARKLLENIMQQELLGVCVKIPFWSLDDAIQWAESLMDI